MSGVTMPCACGGEIWSAADDARSIFNAVQLHNDTLRHHEWRSDPERRMEWAAVQALKRQPKRRCPCNGHSKDAA